MFSEAAFPTHMHVFFSLSESIQDRYIGYMTSTEAAHAWPRIQSPASKIDGFMRSRLDGHVTCCHWLLPQYGKILIRSHTGNP